MPHRRDVPHAQVRVEEDEVRSSALLAGDISASACARRRCTSHSPNTSACSHSRPASSTSIAERAAAAASPTSPTSGSRGSAATSAAPPRRSTAG
eukprot:CAMPEP_0175734280 /NCGR_PEP_ID=MMETSP0097-20121207/52312_1 /TAXON_ID=311494 /ORGANISM="Alexandrium monilatum, Strain CCMP3105" /LENGTH=94 /DNA_ID=CAMNT_0017042317 /DNA_START=58 /DNA_END=338 /DNA_ORIENTATION=+